MAYRNRTRAARRRAEKQKLNLEARERGVELPRMPRPGRATLAMRRSSTCSCTVT
jgi:hypothetical protein